MEIRVLSEMARVFLDGVPERYENISGFYAFSGESAAFQVAYGGSEYVNAFTVETESDINLDMYQVRYMPVQMTGSVEGDNDYLDTKPGLFPDFLDFKPKNSIFDCHGNDWQSLYFICEKAPAGRHRINVIFRSWPEGEVINKAVVTLNVSKKALPAQTQKYTRWFHCDSLADYYNVPVFSSKHWKIIENFLKKAAQRGMNTVLTPIHTPPLDTEVSKERRTVQLVDIEDLGNGEYGFSFEKFDKWVRICRRAGIRYFEMAHLFTQWGLKCAPKIVAKQNGEEKVIFGWDTESESEKYLDFLSQYLPALYFHLEEMGIEKNCFFHISDEPNIESIDLYMKLKNKVKAIIPHAYFTDAMSDIDFYDRGACEHPVPSVAGIEPFADAEVKDLWTYYCCGERYLVPNSFIAMPGERIRALGVLMYVYKIKGFLQWGYNYYYGRHTRYPLDPYRNTDGDGTWPSGDPFIVYPSSDGHALDSLRSIEMQKALEDVRALTLAEEKLGRENVMSIIKEDFDRPMTFTDYPRNDRYFLNLRKKLFDAMN